MMESPLELVALDGWLDCADCERAPSRRTGSGCAKIAVTHTLQQTKTADTVTNSAPVAVASGTWLPKKYTELIYLATLAKISAE